MEAKEAQLCQSQTCLSYQNHFMNRDQRLDHSLTPLLVLLKQLLEELKFVLLLHFHLLVKHLCFLVFLFTAMLAVVNSYLSELQSLSNFSSSLQAFWSDCLHLYLINQYADFQTSNHFIQESCHLLCSLLDCMCRTDRSYQLFIHFQLLLC